MPAVGNQPPNILLITTDQQRADTIGAWQAAIGRERTAHSPWADSLAREGVLFTQAHTEAPVCSPSRVTLLMGVHVPVHELLENGVRQPRANVSTSWPALLSQRGYQTAVIGKTDVGGLPPHTFDYADIHGGNTERRTGNVSTSAFLETYLVNATIGWISLVRSRSRSQRWAVHTSFVSPHPPFDGPADNPWAHVYDGRALPASRAANTAKPDAEPLQTRGLEGGSSIVTDAARRSYYNLAAFVDAQLGRLLLFLRSEAELFYGTLVIYTSDHGCALGDHGVSQKHTFHDTSLRVPLIMRLPGVLPAAAVRTFASTVDLPATIVAAASGVHTTPAVL